MAPSDELRTHAAQVKRAKAEQLELLLAEVRECSPLASSECCSYRHMRIDVRHLRHHLWCLVQLKARNDAMEDKVVPMVARAKVLAPQLRDRVARFERVGCSGNFFFFKSCAFSRPEV